MFKAKIYVTLKESILDPQGTAINKALMNSSYSNVDDVRVGKFIQLKVNESDKDKAESQVKEMCERILSNPVIENYTYILEG